MYRKIIIVISLFAFLFAVNASSASMEKRNAVPNDFKKEFNSKHNQDSSDIDQISAEMEMIEFIMDYQILGWKPDTTLLRKIMDILTLGGWALAWFALFTVATGGLFPVLLALAGVAFMSFQGPVALDSIFS